MIVTLVDIKLGGVSNIPFLSFISQLAVMVLIAVMCSTAKSSMSKVKFHWVATSCGIIFSGTSRSRRIENQCGRRRVVEFLIVNVTFRSCVSRYQNITNFII